MADTNTSRSALLYPMLVLLALVLTGVLVILSRRSTTSAIPHHNQMPVTYIPIAPTRIPTSTPIPTPFPRQTVVAPPEIDWVQRLTDAQRTVYQDPVFVLSELEMDDESVLTPKEQKRRHDLIATAYAELYQERMKYKQMPEAKALLRLLEKKYPDSTQTERVQKQWGTYLKREWRRLKDRVPSRADDLFDEWAKKPYHDQDAIFMNEFQSHQLQRFTRDMRMGNIEQARKRLRNAARVISDMRSLGAFSSRVNRSSLSIQDVLDIAREIEDEGRLSAPLAIPFYIALNDKLNQGVRNHELLDYTKMTTYAEFIQDKMVELTLLAAEAIKTDQSVLLTAYNPESFYQNAIEWSRNNDTKAVALGHYMEYLVTELEEYLAPILVHSASSLRQQWEDDPDAKKRFETVVNTCNTLYYAKLLPASALFVDALLAGHLEDDQALRDAAAEAGVLLGKNATRINQNRAMVLAVRTGKWLPEIDGLHLVGLMMADLKRLQAVLDVPKPNAK